jgi:hypothetical protein
MCLGQVEEMAQLDDKPFLFILNFQVPGDPPLSLVYYFALPASVINGSGDPEDPFMATFCKYLDFTNQGITGSTEANNEAGVRSFRWPCDRLRFGS